jgi:hypothetical protein
MELLGPMTQDYCILVCDSVKFGVQVPTDVSDKPDDFHGQILLKIRVPGLSELKVSTYQTTRCHAQEDRLTTAKHCAIIRHSNGSGVNAVGKQE